MSSEANTRRRVKLYYLLEGKWVDKGTGHVSAISNDLYDASLVVISETDGTPLLDCKIQQKIEYHKQQETLIVWTEGDFDLALSFQERSGCDDIWDKVCRVQRRECYLPPCHLSKLEEISDIIIQAVNLQDKRENLGKYIERQSYIPKLIDLFEKAEDTEDMESLHHLFEIARHLILLNIYELFKIMFSDKNIMSIIGMMEYTPAGRIHHREFLKKTQFRDIFVSKSPDFINKIHQTYRVQYIQDCCLPPPCLFDEHSLTNLKAFIIQNKASILSMLHDDPEFFQCLFMRLRKTDTVASKRDLTYFAKEYCNLAVQTDQKETSLQVMYNHGALKALEILIKNEDKETRTTALEILQTFVDYHASLIREYTYQDSLLYAHDEILINIMINQMLKDKDPEMSDANVISNMLRQILDPENMNNGSNRSEKTEFLNFFYKHCMGCLTKPFFENTQKDGIMKDDYHTALVMCHILDILIFCFESHIPLMRTYCFNKDLLHHVLILSGSKHNFLALYSLRLFRRVVGLKDEFYQRYIMKNYLFRFVIDLFKRNQHRYNLIDSAVIELFHFINYENITPFITHIIDNYGDDLKEIDYVQTFAELRNTYDCITTGKLTSNNSPLLQGKPQLNVMHLVSNASLGGAGSTEPISSTSSVCSSGIEESSSSGVEMNSSNSMRQGTFRDPNLNRLSDMEEEKWLDDDSDDSNPRNIDDDDLDDATFPSDLHRPGRQSGTHVSSSALANLQNNPNFDDDDIDDEFDDEDDSDGENGAGKSVNKKVNNYLNSRRMRFSKTSLLAFPNNNGTASKTSISINIKSNSVSNNAASLGSSESSDEDDEEDEEQAMRPNSTSPVSPFKRSRRDSENLSDEYDFSDGNSSGGSSSSENKIKKLRISDESIKASTTITDKVEEVSKSIEEASEKSSKEEEEPIGPSIELRDETLELEEDTSKDDIKPSHEAALISIPNVSKSPSSIVEYSDDDEESERNRSQEDVCQVVPRSPEETEESLANS